MANETTGSADAGKTHPTIAKETPSPETTTPEERHAEAEKVVKNFTWWSGGAGLIPIPFADILAVGGIQLQMLRRISQIYNVPFSENRGKSVISSLAGSLIPASSGAGAASLLKSVPVIGTGIGSVVMSSLSAGATYAIGMVFIQHFASGGTLLDFSAPDYHDFVKSQKELWSSRSRRSPTESTAPAGSGTSSTAAT